MYIHDNDYDDDDDDDIYTTCIVFLIAFEVMAYDINAYKHGPRLSTCLQKKK